MPRRSASLTICLNGLFKMRALSPQGGGDVIVQGERRAHLHIMMTHKDDVKMLQGSERWGIVTADGCRSYRLCHGTCADPWPGGGRPRRAGSTTALFIPCAGLYDR